MAIKKTDGRRWVEMEFLVPGTPEQVWDAIATGPGMSAWFTPTQVDERIGGAIEFDFGDGAVSSGVITEWEPPARLGYEEHGWNGEAPPVATEVVVTSHSGDRCVVRMVHSLFTDRDDWDGELESFETGWPGFFEVLRLYLREFPGQRAANAVAMTQVPADLVQGWATLASALGIAGVDVGQRFRTPSGTPELHGVVHRIHQAEGFRDVIVRLEGPCPGVAVVGGCAPGGEARIMVNLYLYGDDAADTAAAEAPKWRSWMAQLVHADRAST
ncbi:SRPBCC family protein [Mycolicibacterium iranicum]|uniref:SRPBCC domain-containing protein n=1 Tax=Mycolicibacterium iranicum TaxID=912594 RepID=A0ABT4HCQ4_MYCIR|nr:SRPBCC domain-containing protein [Mycolicibacterium iranicum]MCZ0727743.1 SRPBCC domain-containing protein [Mycolicibacterium iranicum]